MYGLLFKAAKITTVYSLVLGFTLNLHKTELSSKFSYEFDQYSATVRRSSKAGAALGRFDRLLQIGPRIFFSKGDNFGHLDPLAAGPSFAQVWRPFTPA